MKALRILVMTFFLAGLFNCNVMASVLFNSQPATGGYQFDAVTNNPYASFSTGGSAMDLNYVWLFLYPSSTTGATTLVNLYADNNTMPGALIGSIGTVADNYSNFQPSGSAVWTPSYNLAANTRYWIGLSTTNNSSNTWMEVLGTNNTTGVVSEYRVSGGQRYANSTNGAVFMFLMGNEIPSVVPEPSTYVLLCISLGVVGYARKKMSVKP